jgi:hypothetical protein
MAEITAARINNLQSRIELILGTGSGQNGYGQTLESSQVSGGNSGDIVTAEDLNKIYADILTARIHQVGPGDIGVAEVVQNLNVVAEDESFFVDDDGVTTADPDGDKKGIADFESMMSVVEADKALVDSSQASLEPAINSVRTSSWNGLIYHEFTVTFADADQRRYFFNTGGEIRLSASNTNASAPKGLDWSALCTSVGTIKFGSNTTISTTGGGSSIGNYNLTGTYQTVYSKVGSGDGSGVYAANTYSVKVRSDIDDRLIFRVEYNDLAVDNVIDNNVDGRLESTIEHWRADGDVSVTAPTYYNSHTLA